jgi:phage shock protein PspC (stress-responsive transcriptional regulator)
MGEMDGGNMPKEETKEVKRVYRSKKNKMLAGVCGGIAEYFDIDPVLVRLLLVLLVLMGFAGIILYLVAWLIMPENPNQ